MRWISPAIALSLLVLPPLAGPGLAAGELVFSCSILSMIDISDVQPYRFSVRIDGARQAILDVDGDQGLGWVTDRFSDERIEAHFDLRTGLAA